MKLILLEWKKISASLLLLGMIFGSAYWLLQLENVKDKYYNPSFKLYARR